MVDIVGKLFFQSNFILLLTQGLLMSLVTLHIKSDNVSGDAA